MRRILAGSMGLALGLTAYPGFAQDVRWQQVGAPAVTLGPPAVALGALAVATLLYSFPTVDTIANTFTAPPEISQYRVRAVAILAIAIASSSSVLIMQWVSWMRSEGTVPPRLKKSSNPRRLCQ